MNPRPRRRRERGAILVELSIVAPFLIMLVAMGLELGLVLRDHMTVASAARSGARVGSSAQTTRLADYELLQAVGAGLGSVDPADVEAIVVFKPDASGHMPSTCRTHSVNGRCNRYTAVDLSRPATDFTGVSTCLGSAPDKAWCPLDRIRDQASATGPDWLGVYLQIRHRTAVPAFRGDVSVSDRTVMRLEPRFGP